MRIALRLPSLVSVALCALFIITATRPASAWDFTVAVDDIAYFASRTSTTLQRFDLAAGTWLEPIDFGRRPTAFTADDEALYVSFGRSTVAFDHDGGGERHLVNTTADATDVVVSGYLAFVTANGRVWSVGKRNGESLDREDYFYSFSGVSVSPVLNRLFGRSSNVSPSDIFWVDFDLDGELGQQFDSPYHGGYPDADRTWVLPDGVRVVDSAGIVYNGNDLSYAGSLGGAIDDLSTYRDLPIILRGTTLLSLTNTFLEAGRYELPEPAAGIHVYGDTVYAFGGGVDAIAYTAVPVSELTPPEPGEPVDPRGLAYAPDAVFMGTDDVVYILSRGHLSVFRWSVAQQDYIDTIPLVEAPKFMAYSAELSALFFAYPGGRLSVLSLAEGAAETVIANAPESPCGLAAAGEFVFICDPIGAWVSHLTYDIDGTLITQREWNYYSQEYVWDAATRRMYFLRDDTSPNDLHYEEVLASGALGAQGETPYHGSSGIRHPIRVAPDGSYILLGSGYVYDSVGLSEMATLPHVITDAAWVQETLYTMRDIAPDTQVQEWADGFRARTGYLQLPGAPFRLLATDDRLVAMTTIGDMPQFSVHSVPIGTPLPTHTRTVTGTPTTTPTPTITRTPTVTRTPENTRTRTATPSASPTRAPGERCPGDCDDDGTVTIDELVLGVGLALELRAGECLALDRNESREISINELVAAVDSALRGCGGTR